MFQLGRLSTIVILPVSARTVSEIGDGVVKTEREEVSNVPRKRIATNTEEKREK